MYSMKARHLPIISGLTIFSGAFLLFQVQPLMGKFLLPWFGGMPEVWTICLLFFQLLLLAGYLYAHLSGVYLSLRRQLVLHSLLCLAALVLVRVVPRARLKPEEQFYATAQILLILSASIGVAYFVLASTGPLLQRWLSRTYHRHSPYWLYAVSNGASLCALLSYPFLVEPNLTRQVQARVWTVGLGFFTFFSIGTAVFVWRLGELSVQKDTSKNSPEGAVKPSFPTLLTWLLLSAVGAILLMAVTNILCQDLAAVPFLWVVPLSVYLLTFVLCFRGERDYARQVFLALFFILLPATGLVWMKTFYFTASLQVCVYVLMLFVACMVCHGELYRMRPGSRHLTGFYLMIAAGGAAGGIFVVVLAPLLFNSYIELHLGLLACCAVVLLTDRNFMQKKSRWGQMAWLGVLMSAGIVFFLTEGRINAILGRPVTSYRNFFGVLRILEIDENDPERHAYVFQHGNIIHGLQFSSPQHRSTPTAYYGRTSGVGLAMRTLQEQKEHLRIGVVGLGVGTLAAYAREGDYVCFYEINDAVYQLAQSRFTYLNDCPAQTDVIIGDARLSLERQPPQQFDIVVLDAFSSDAIPIHLMTEEAFQVYLKHLHPGGVLAFHASNKHLDLESVVIQTAGILNMEYVWIKDLKDEMEHRFDSDWILLTNNKSFLKHERIQSAVFSHGRILEIRPWTDDFANLFHILK